MSDLDLGLTGRQNISSRTSAVYGRINASLRFEWLKRNERLLKNSKLVFNEVLFANTFPICVDLSSRFRQH